MRVWHLASGKISEGLMAFIRKFAPTKISHYTVFWHFHPLWLHTISLYEVFHHFKVDKQKRELSQTCSPRPMVSTRSVFTATSI